MTKMGVNVLGRFGLWRQEVCPGVAVVGTPTTHARRALSEHGHAQPKAGLGEPSMVVQERNQSPARFLCFAFALAHVLWSAALAVLLNGRSAAHSCRIIADVSAGRWPAGLPQPQQIGARVGLECDPGVCVQNRVFLEGWWRGG